MNNAEALVPSIMFVSFALVFIAMFWFRYKTRSQLQQTIRGALDKGIELSPDVIDRLGAPKPPKAKDLRLGVIWMSLAIALVLIGIVIPEPEALRGLLAGAAIPFCIGSAYLLLYYLVSGKEE